MWCVEWWMCVHVCVFEHPPSEDVYNFSFRGLVVEQTAENDERWNWISLLLYIKLEQQQQKEKCCKWFSFVINLKLVLWSLPHIPRECVREYNHTPSLTQFSIKTLMKILQILLHLLLAGIDVWESLKFRATRKLSIFQRLIDDLHAKLKKRKVVEFWWEHGKWETGKISNYNSFTHPIT